jgi:hypothetical protein
LVVGLTVAIPGMVHLARTSDIEKRALHRYHAQDLRPSAAPPRPLSNLLSSQPSVTGFAVPVLRMRF